MRLWIFAVCCSLLFGVSAPVFAEADNIAVNAIDVQSLAYFDARVTTYSISRFNAHHNPWLEQGQWFMHITGWDDGNGNPIRWYPIAADPMWQSGYVVQDPHQAAKFVIIGPSGHQGFFIVMNTMSPGRYFSNIGITGSRFEFKNTRIDFPKQVAMITGIYDWCENEHIRVYVVDEKINPNQARRFDLLSAASNFSTIE